MINQIKEDMKQAMRDKNKVKLSTLRMLLATIDNERIKLRVEELSDDQIITCVNRNLKQLDQEIESLINAQRNIDDALLQTEVLRAYLPEQLTEEEIESRVMEAVIMSRTASPTRNADMKTVMFRLSDLKGRANMKLVSQMVKEMI